MLLSKLHIDSISAITFFIQCHKKPIKFTDDLLNESTFVSNLHNFLHLNDISNPNHYNDLEKV